MPVRTSKFNGNQSIVLFEEYVGYSQKGICYPNISSCITITGVGLGGLIGTHITVVSKIDIVDDILTEMVAYGGDSIRNCYVIGAIVPFKKRRKENQQKDKFKD
jgi:hypothetical protein